ncbi:PfaD family polyunsaturated fatty acid/polyketide biosynthesis protein [Paractinoplanes rishiriensis]|uniref:Oxidoreductase n=1 Tax=Paractinoplanes rishiriensis TaxID=1050105 RepID=A0A919JZA5_9ACTN|nr:PfaD family polyunsaturated fatty acid/polyketide biosynthesis protein [Actinoplanes rishiriensis]GIE97468.1 oxidoreductase [Actinoplanes rishiriensis]
MVDAYALAPALGWLPGERAADFSPAGIVECVRRFREPVHIVRGRAGHEPGLGLGGRVQPPAAGASPGYELVGVLPALYPEWLGDRSFNRTHGVRFPYVAGEMANGIATVASVTAMARARMLGFFGAAGLAVPAVETAVRELRQGLPDRDNWGVNLIHSPAEPGHEERLADVLIRAGVPKVSASAYLDLTPAVVRCAVAGLRADPGADAGIARARQLFAKVSRPEVAAKFLSPAPPEILRRLVERGQITTDEAGLAARVPLAEDVTVEADSGGHTDNRPLAVVLPVITALRDELHRRHGYARPIRIGAAGGLGDPAGVAAAFAAGAAYVVTGTVNQLAREAGLSDAAKGLLAQADLADVTMAPAADMFEYGVKVQVLRRGTLFAARAGQLYETFLAHQTLADIPGATRERLEKDVFRATFEDCWQETRRFWLDRDPREVDRAEHDPRHRMALVFRSYLGLSSRWAITGEPTRLTDYQIWCGPAIGAFNRWVAGSPLAQTARRTVVQIALNLLEGAAMVTRAHQLRSYGVPVPGEAFAPRPRLLS